MSTDDGDGRVLRDSAVSAQGAVPPDASADGPAQGGNTEPPDVLTEAAALNVSSVAEVPEVKQYLLRLASKHGCTISASMRTARLQETDGDGIDGGGWVPEEHAPTRRYRRDVATIRFKQDGGKWSIKAEPAQAGDGRDFGPTEDEQRAIVAALASVVLPRSAPVPNSGLVQVRHSKKGEKKLALLRDVDLNGLPEQLVALIKKEPELKAAELPSSGRPGVDMPNKTPVAHSYFVLRNPQGEIVMVQHRIDCIDDSKSYVPYSYWIDAKGIGQWHRCEPDGKLPLYGIEQLAHHPGASMRVFLHEGAKAAATVRAMVEAGTDEMKAKLAAHPWREDLQGGVHLGWVGGALNPSRTDWSLLRAANISCVFIVGDNDKDGQEAVPKVSRRLHDVEVLHVRFTGGDWPKGFDLADPFPDAKMFRTVQGKLPGEAGRKIYTGPTFVEVLEPATWATEKVQTSKPGRPEFFLRKSFARQWIYVKSLRQFVYRANTNIRYDAETANGALRTYSDVLRLADKMMAACEGVNTLTYAPDREPSAVINIDGRTAINTFQPSHHHDEGRRHIDRGDAPRDASVWIEFLEYLFPDSPHEANRDLGRREVMRWIATLIARPDIKMIYSLLLISEAQGTGKTTLAGILAQLVGRHNCSFPNGAQINGAYNSWMAHKRLAVANEIYEGQGWTAYHRLKTTITDKCVMVNEKFEKSYEVDNWCHLIAASNSDHPLRMDADERRWLAPRVTETPWPLAKFRALHEWLRGEGLPAIMDWALRWGDGKAAGDGYVEAGARAPMTERKTEVAKAGRPDEVRRVTALVEDLDKARIGKPFALSSHIARDHLQRQQVEHRPLDKHLRLDEFDGGLGDVGLQRASSLDPRLGRVKLGGAEHSPRLSASAMEAVRAVQPDELAVEAAHAGDHDVARLEAQRALIRGWLKEAPRLLADAAAAAKKEAGEEPL